MVIMSPPSFQTSEHISTPMKMPTAHIFIGTSLDGFIARQPSGSETQPSNSLDWLLPFSQLGEDHGFDAHMESMDCVVMGRKTFHFVRDTEPWIYGKPVLVLSRTLAGPDVPQVLAERTDSGWPRVQIVSGEPKEIMQEVARRGWRRVYVDGGEVIKSFLRGRLVESVVISRVPVLIGAGVPLFGELSGDVKLVHEGTRSWESGVVQSRYRVVEDEV